MSNLYYAPEKFDLEVVDSWDFSDGNYQFDLRCIWRNKAGELLSARDSGCSCPCPFQDLGVKDLESVRKNALKEEAIEAAKADYYGGDSLSTILEKIEKLK